MPLQQQAPDITVLERHVHEQRSAFAGGGSPSVRSEGPPAEPKHGQPDARHEQQLKGAVQPQAAADVRSAGSWDAGVAQGALAEISLHASVASSWQRFAPPPSLSGADSGIAIRGDSTSSAPPWSNRTGVVPCVRWGSWLAKRDDHQQPATQDALKLAHADATRRATAWQTTAYGKRSMQQSESMFVTTSD